MLTTCSTFCLDGSLLSMSSAFHVKLAKAITVERLSRTAITLLVE